AGKQHGDVAPRIGDALAEQFLHPRQQGSDLRIADGSARLPQIGGKSRAKLFELIGHAQPPTRGTSLKKRASLTGVTRRSASRSVTCSPLNRMMTRPLRTASSATSICRSTSSSRRRARRGPLSSASSWAGTKQPTKLLSPSLL